MRLKKERLNLNDSKSFHISTGWLNLTNTCNSSCEHCYRQNDLNKKKSDIKFSLANQVIDFFGQLEIYSCIFLGGEPTLYPNLSNLIRKSKKVGISEVTVVTNGRLLHNEKFVNDLIDSGIDVFSISIHSTNQLTHDTISRTHSFYHTIQGIRNVVKSEKKCSINVIANNRNIDEIPITLSTLLDLGVDEIIVSCAIPYINGESINGLYALDPFRFAELIEKIRAFSQRVKILHELPLCLIPKDTFLQLAEQNRLGFGCHIGVGRGLSIDVDGKVIPCNSFSSCSLLDLFEDEKIKYSAEEFIKIWLNDEYICSIRNEANVYRSEICKECDLWELCNCGCPLTWGHYDLICTPKYGHKVKIVYS